MHTLTTVGARDQEIRNEPHQLQGGINGIVGNTSIDDLPDKLAGRHGAVTETFSYPAAFAPRQFQFSLRLTFWPGLALTVCRAGDGRDAGARLTSED